MICILSIFFFMNKSSLFFEMSTPYYLYFSWIELKNLYGFHKFPFYKPIRLVWFEKASTLLRSGSYFYVDRKMFFPRNSNFKKSYFLVFHNKIIENAVFNIIYPFFHVYFLKKNSFFFSINCVFLGFNFIYFIFSTY